MMDTTLTKTAIDIFNYGVKAADPIISIKRHIARNNNILTAGKKQYPLDDFEHVHIIGFGKAGAPMAAALEEILNDNLTSGIVIVKYKHLTPLNKVQLIEAGHPVPDKNSLKGARAVLELVSQCTAKDLILCAISGGGSALLTLPVPTVSLEDIQELTEQLLAAGANIHEINTLRKHLSQVKGGHLARAAHPATMISLILSDVIGDDPSTISSGPTAPDTTTFNDCQDIIRKYQLNPPENIEKYLDKGLKGEATETPKPNDPAFNNIHNLIAGNNYQAITAAASRAKELGFNPMILSTSIEGDTCEAAGFHTAILKETIKSGNPLQPPACIISGGETTVKLTGSGLGGRNQEFALHAATHIQGIDNVAVLSGGSDGTDGPTDAAGAIATGNTIQRGKKAGMKAEKYLANNDTYHYFDRLGDLIKTGPTNTNVMDLRIMMIGER